MTYCYGEVFEEELAKEEHNIIASWKDKDLSEDKKESINNMRNLEENPDPYSEIEESRTSFLLPFPGLSC